MYIEDATDNRCFNVCSQGCPHDERVEEHDKEHSNQPSKRGIRNVLPDRTTGRTSRANANPVIEHHSVPRHTLGVGHNIILLIRADMV